MIHVTKVSSNQKTGPILVTTTSAATCPNACPLKSMGCYAAYGNIKIHWDKVTRGERGGPLDAAVAAIKELPPSSVWRHCQAGDQLGDGKARINRKHTMVLAEACSTPRHSVKSGKSGTVRCLTYTHYPPTKHNLGIVRDAARHGMVINLSANTLAHADKLAVHGLPLVAIVPHGTTGNTQTPEGRKVFLCPAQVKDNVTCDKCRLCANDHPNRPIIGFLPHGSGHKKVPKQ